MKQQSWRPVYSFIILLISLLLIRTLSKEWLIDHQVLDYNIHLLLGIVANIILTFISIYYIKKHHLLLLSGIKKQPLKKPLLLLFPLIYLVLMNLVFSDMENAQITLANLSMLLLYTISIGVAEELSIRGFLQTYLLKHFSHKKKHTVTIILSVAFFFGVLHLIKFDKGFYGELSQVFFAAFIGALFGILLLITKRIYPLIIIHAAIDFAAKIDTVGVPVAASQSGGTSLVNAILTVLLVLPCLLVALFLMRKHFLPMTEKQYPMMRKIK